MVQDCFEYLFEAVCERIGGIFRNVVALAKIYVLQKKASSVKAILTEFRDAEGHAAIHYAANLGSNEICEWILDEAPECVPPSFLQCHRSWRWSMRLATLR